MDSIALPLQDVPLTDLHSTWTIQQSTCIRRFGRLLLRAIVDLLECDVSLSKAQLLAARTVRTGAAATLLQQLHTYHMQKFVNRIRAHCMS